jgi:hypothetical protein
MRILQSPFFATLQTGKIAQRFRCYPGFKSPPILGRKEAQLTMVTTPPWEEVSIEAA